MEYQYLVDFVDKNRKKCNNRFIITIDGKKIEKRLFVSSNYYLCEFIEHSRKKGRIVSNCLNWENIEMKPIYKKSEYDRLINTVKKANAYLLKSGLWKSLRADFDVLLSTERNVLENIINEGYDAFKAFRSEHNLFMSYDLFFNLFYTGIKTMRFNRYERDYYINLAKKAIEEKTDFRASWECGYDNKFEILNECEELRAWYSEEYRGCLNGYYYLLIDEKHVLFIEKD